MSIYSDRAQHLAKARGWTVWKFGPQSKSLRFTKGDDEVIVHFAADGRMRQAIHNGKPISGGGLPRVMNILEKGSKK